MSGIKFYVVWKGKRTGIFESWQECEDQVRGYEGAVYKSFPSREAAENAFAGDYRDFVRKKSAQTAMDLSVSSVRSFPVWDSLSVDAACSGNPGILEYRGVWTQSGAEVFREGPFPEGTVNLGEFLAIVHGLALLQQRGLTCPVYSDSRTALKWVKDRAIKTKLPRTPSNQKLFELVDRALKWLHEYPHHNPLLKWDTVAWGENPADFGRK
ncbi:MAG: ribonuclease H family protein [Bacteroidales bacterium]|nr:ribonuclease H family protein [Lentimicrobiaceae bacterium]MDD5694176.1 ribonuclease H family protein [Bacteroidales bacterium]